MYRENIERHILYRPHRVGTAAKLFAQLTDLQQGRRDCHRLQFKAMLSDDPQLRAERDRVCAQAPDPSNKPQ